MTVFLTPQDQNEHVFPPLAPCRHFFFFYSTCHSHSLSSGYDQNAEASRIPGLRGGEGRKDHKLFVLKMESLTLGHLL